MPIDFARLTSPVIDRGPHEAVRDMTLLYERGTLYCIYSSVTRDGGRYQWSLESVHSTDGVVWSIPHRLTQSKMNFSSPGNILRHGNKWIMCVQSYPIGDGERVGSEDSRLWLMTSEDLASWTQPEPLQPQGCQANWAESRRQIDPYIVRFDDKFWCFYKTSGQLGVLVSDDLQRWQEASTDRPVLGTDQTPDQATLENPCVVQADGRFALFFARVGEGRGLGLAFSEDLLSWTDVHYLDFPSLEWATHGATAPMVIDLRSEYGIWLMAFHGERRLAAELDLWDAAIGLAWSNNLEQWTVPRSRQ